MIFFFLEIHKNVFLAFIKIQNSQIMLPLYPQSPQSSLFNQTVPSHLIPEPQALLILTYLIVV